MKDATFPPAPHHHHPPLTAHHYTQATTDQFVREALVPTLPAELFSSSPALQWQVLIRGAAISLPVPFKKKRERKTSPLHPGNL